MTVYDTHVDQTWQEQQHLTCGSWATEAAAEVALDERLQSCGIFRIYRQVVGRPLLMAPTNDAQDFRIDRIIFPTPDGRIAGWNLGPIGIECKRSGEKLGRPVSQMLDYRNAAYKLPDSDTWFMLNWVFLWPAKKIGGPLASVMAQNRVGTVNDGWRQTLQFNAGSNVIARAGSDGFEVSDLADRIGRKVGSR